MKNGSLITCSLLAVLLFSTCQVREEEKLTELDFDLQPEFSVPVNRGLNIPVENIVTSQGFQGMQVEIVAGEGRAGVGETPEFGDETGSGTVQYISPSEAGTAVLRVSVIDLLGRRLGKETLITIN